MAFFKIFSYDFVIFEISKRKIKQEVDLVLLFELFSTGKRKTEQSNLTSIVIGQKSTNQIAQYMVESWCGFAHCYRHREHLEGLCIIFGEYSDIVENDILTMLRILDVSIF